MQSHEFQGKNIFTKLGDVIELKRKDRDYDSHLTSKKTISNLGNQKIIMKKDEENLKRNKETNPINESNSIKKFKHHVKLSEVLNKNSVIVENSKEDQFLSIIKGALARNKKLLGDPKRYIDHIDDKIKRMPNIIIENNDFDFFEEEIPPHKLKQKLEENETAKKISDMIKRNKENQNLKEEHDENKFNTLSNFFNF